MAKRYKISKGKAIDLQEWALMQSGAKKYLEALPKFPEKGKVKSGIYVNYKIDEDELDGGIDWPTPAIATICVVLKNDGENIYLGEIRAYNFETYWLSTREYKEVDTIKNWFELINDDYEKLVKMEKKNNKANQNDKEL
mgnify:CR=1 FL=1